MLLCVGEFFGPDDEENRRVSDGELQFPITTYVLGLLQFYIQTYFEKSVISLTLNHSVKFP